MVVKVLLLAIKLKLCQYCRHGEGNEGDKHNVSGAKTAGSLEHLAQPVIID